MQKDRFDLEAAIMEAWSTSEDMDLIYHNTDNLELTPIERDMLQNQLLGLKHIADLRFQKVWDTFSSLVSNGSMCDCSDDKQIYEWRPES
tara:strand:+ start:77 stop:346 length:270 start_codon:yes stop_codon:yes gene_type:complete